MFNGYRVSLLQDEKVLEIACQTMKLHLTVLNCTLKIGKDGKFYVVRVLSPLNKKKLGMETCKKRGWLAAW